MRMRKQVVEAPPKMSVISCIEGEDPPPVSLEAERRKTMTIIHKVEKEIPAFREKHLKKLKPQFPEDFQDFVQFIVDRNQLKRYPKNPTEFVNLISKVRDAAEVLYKSEVEQMETAVATFHVFCAAVQDFCERLTVALERHVGRYCHSYSSEAGQHDIPAVQFYENNITRWRGQIKEAFTLLDDIMRNIKDTAINLEYFITNFPRAVHYMGLSLDVFPRIYNPLKDWVTSDEAYVRRLQEEMEELKREKVSLDSLARRHRMQAGGIQSKVIRSQHHSTTLRGRLVAARDERRACRKRELSVMDATVKIESELYQRKQALSRTLRNLSQDDPSLTTRREQLVDNSSLLSDQIARLEKKMAGMKTELKNVKKERIAAQKEFHRMQVLHEKNTKLEHDIKDDADDATQDVRDIEEERRILGEKVIALARIREIKNDPNTIKVIHKEGFAPGRKFDVSEGLEEACRTAASEIGRDWPMLSSPRRWSGSKFNFNLSARSESSVHGSEISKCGSTRSLDQWSRVSQEASSNALGRTLRSMHRHSRHSKADDDVVTTVN